MAYVGDRDPTYGATCAYTGPTADGPRCARDATHHLLLDDERHGVVAVAACEEHAPVARSAAILLAVHDFAWVCGLPGTDWLMPENVCVLDGTGIGPLEAATAAPAPLLAAA